MFADKNPINDPRIITRHKRYMLSSDNYMVFSLLRFIQRPGAMEYLLALIFRICWQFAAYDSVVLLLC